MSRLREPLAAECFGGTNHRTNERGGSTRAKAVRLQPLLAFMLARQSHFLWPVWAEEGDSLG
jgi:hypothetical protein